MTALSEADFKLAQELGGFGIKMIASSSRDEQDNISIFVSPSLIPRNSPFYSVTDADNLVFVNTSNIPSGVCFGGSGAGRFPTANAVVADIFRLCRALSQINEIEKLLSDSPNAAMNIDCIKQIIRNSYPCPLLDIRDRGMFYIDFNLYT